MSFANYIHTFTNTDWHFPVRIMNDGFFDKYFQIAVILLNQSILTGDSSGARLHLNVISSNETKELRRELMHRYISRLLREGAQRKRPVRVFFL